MDHVLHLWDCDRVEQALKCSGCDRVREFVNKSAVGAASLHYVEFRAVITVLFFLDFLAAQAAKNSQNL